MVCCIQAHRDSVLFFRDLQRRLNDLRADQLMQGIQWSLDRAYCRTIEVVVAGNSKGIRPLGIDSERNPAIHDSRILNPYPTDNTYGSDGFCRVWLVAVFLKG